MPVAAQGVDLGDPASPGARFPHQVHHQVEGCPELAVQGRPVHPGQRAERLQPDRDVRRRVGVDRPRAALVAGVEGGQQVGHLGSAHLADHQPVGAHPQCLADEVPQGQLAQSLLIGRPGLEPHHVRVVGQELGGVLGDDDPLLRTDQAEQRREECGLPGAGAPAHQQREPGPHYGRQQLAAARRECPARHQLVDGEGPGAAHPQ